jgi:hypothetical protein
MITNIFGTRIRFDAFVDERAKHTQVIRFVSPWWLVVPIGLRPVISSRRTTPNE